MIRSVCIFYHSFFLKKGKDINITQKKSDKQLASFREAKVDLGFLSFWSCLEYPEHLAMHGRVRWFTLYLFQVPETCQKRDLHHNSTDPFSLLLPICSLWPLLGVNTSALDIKSIFMIP